jgi:hypothetical protein
MEYQNAEFYAVSKFVKKIFWTKSYSKKQKKKKSENSKFHKGFCL